VPADQRGAHRGFVGGLLVENDKQHPRTAAAQASAVQTRHADGRKEFVHRPLVVFPESRVDADFKSFDPHNLSFKVAGQI